MMFVHTIRRAFSENLDVFRCKPCGFSMTEPVSWKMPTQQGGGLLEKPSQKRPLGNLPGD